MDVCRGVMFTSQDWLFLDTVEDRGSRVGVIPKKVSCKRGPQSASAISDAIEISDFARCSLLYRKLCS